MTKYKEYTITKAELTRKLLFIITPIATLMSLPYLILHYQLFINDILSILIKHVFESLAVLIAGIFIHEFLHGLSWALLSGKGFKPVKFGIDSKSLTPYCHFKAPIIVRQYIWGGIMPFLVQGIVPVIFSWFTGNPALFLFGIVFIFAAGSDVLICHKVIGLNKNCIVQDFPDKAGCYTVQNKKENKIKN